MLELKTTPRSVKFLIAHALNQPVINSISFILSFIHQVNKAYIKFLVLTF